MRGLYTLWLTQLYGDVPLKTSTILTPEMEEQVSAKDKIYPQILADFVSAINLMGEKAFAGDGHANKYVAEGFAARAWMFYAGFYENVKELANGDAPITLPKNADGTYQEGCDKATILKADIVAYP